MKKIARIYCRVSTQEQDLSRQLELKEWAEQRGFYIAKIYSEKASGRTANRPALNEMLADLQAEEFVIAENIDRLSRLPIKEAEQLIQQIRNKGARLLLPNVLDATAAEYAPDSMEGIIFNAMQDLLLKILLKSASDDYELRRQRQLAGINRARKEGKRIGGRPMAQKRIDDVAICKNKGLSNSEIARMLPCSIATVKRIWREIKAGRYKTSHYKP
jgi:resolvase